MDSIQLDLNLGEKVQSSKVEIKDKPDSFENGLEEIRLQANNFINELMQKQKTGIVMKDSLKKIKNK